MDGPPTPRLSAWAWIWCPWIEICKSSQVESAPRLATFGTDLVPLDWDLIEICRSLAIPLNLQHGLPAVLTAHMMCRASEWLLLGRVWNVCGLG